jgi:hypothetical protein
MFCQKKKNREKFGGEHDFKVTSLLENKKTVTLRR